MGSVISASQKQLTDGVVVRCNVRVDDLSNHSQGQMVGDAAEKAELLNNFFHPFLLESLSNLFQYLIHASQAVLVCDITVDTSDIADIMRA